MRLQALFQPRADDGVVYVDPEGNGRVRRAGRAPAAASASAAASAKTPTDDAGSWPKTTPGADPEQGVSPPDGEAFVVRRRGCVMRIYVRFCHFTPLLFMLVLVLGFAWLCSFDRPLALAVKFLILLQRP